MLLWGLRPLGRALEEGTLFAYRVHLRWEPPLRGGPGGPSLGFWCFKPGVCMQACRHTQPCARMGNRRDAEGIDAGLVREIDVSMSSL